MVKQKESTWTQTDSIIRENSERATYFRLLGKFKAELEAIARGDE